MSGLFPCVAKLRLAAIALGVALAVGVVSAEVRGQTAETAADRPTLRLLNWSEYMDPQLLEAFERDAGVQVEELFFENDIARLQIILETEGGQGVDLIVLDDLALPFYIDHGWVAPLDPSVMPNLTHIDPQWWRVGPEFRDYAVPYFWGTFGIAYRTDLVTEPITTWRQLLEPADELQGRIMMLTDPFDLVGAGLMALGHDPNSTSAAELQAAAALLERQRPHLFGYGYARLTEDSGLVTGDVHASTIYSGEAVYLQQYNEDIRYVLPEEGSFLWVDYIAVVQASTQKDTAMRFIDFLNAPENAAQLAEHLYFATPNAAAEALLSETLLNDEAVYPPDDVLARSVFHDAAMPTDAVRIRNEIAVGLTRQR